jgi:hypothetical protein
MVKNKYGLFSGYGGLPHGSRPGLTICFTWLWFYPAGQTEIKKIILQFLTTDIHF